MFAALCRGEWEWMVLLWDLRQEAVSELYASVWGNRSTMQREFTRGAHGEQFVLRELSMKGTQTPSQLASALQASSGRISTVLSSLEKRLGHA